MAHITSTYGPLWSGHNLTERKTGKGRKHVEYLGSTGLPRYIYKTFRNQKGEEITWILLSAFSMSATFTFVPTFIFCCCITNYHRLNGLKQQPFISSQLCRSENSVGSTGSSVHSWNQGFVRLGSSPELLGKICFWAYSGHWPNPGPFSWRTGPLTRFLHLQS